MTFNHDEVPAPENLEQKQENWNTTLENLDSIADSLGHPIDRGIKESVTAFTVNGFPTISSCEGHVEERFDQKLKLSPYVAVGNREPDIRYVGEEEIKQKIAGEFGILVKDLSKNKEADKKYWDYIAKNNVPETPAFLAVRKDNEALESAVKSLLDDFYKERDADGKKINILGVGPAGQFWVTTGERLSENEEIKDEEKAKADLLEEQKEFAKFTEFLKEKYFSKK